MWTSNQLWMDWRLWSSLIHYFLRLCFQVQQKQSPSGDEEGKDSPVRDSDSQYGTWETGLRTDDRLIHSKHLCRINTTIVILSFNDKNRTRFWFHDSVSSVSSYTPRATAGLKFQSVTLSMIQRTKIQTWINPDDKHLRMEFALCHRTVCWSTVNWFLSQCWLL